MKRLVDENISVGTKSINMALLKLLRILLQKVINMTLIENEMLENRYFRIDKIVHTDYFLDNVLSLLDNIFIT